MVSGIATQWITSGSNIYYNTGNVGIGTNNPNATLELYSTTQLSSRIILSGQEFYTNTSIVSGGIALLCGVNRTGNRQLWIGDSANLTQNTTNKILRLMVDGIDCVATNGTTSLPMFLGGGGATTTINGSAITLNGNTTIAGNLTGTGTGISSIANGLNITGATNEPQSLFFRSLGYNVGIAGAAGHYSSSAAANDMILRTIANTKLILQSGSGAGAIIIDSANNTTINGDLILKNDRWHLSMDNIYRFYFAPNSTTYITGGGGIDANGFIVYGSAITNYATNLAITNSGNATIRGDLSIGDGLIYLPKSGNSTGTLKLGIGGATGADDQTNMKIEINGVSNGSSENGNIIIRTYSHIKMYSQYYTAP